MNARYKLVVLIIAIIIIWRSFNYFTVFRNDYSPDELNSLDNEIKKVKITVYYEALCPDSKFFMIYQLIPVFQELKDFLIIDLVPYGKAQTTEIQGKIIFNCQHDAVECFANKIHACVIKLVKDPLSQVKYIACMIADNMIPDDAGDKCGRELEIEYSPIQECANGDTGTSLLKKHGERTHSLNPPVRFIPTIELNDSQTIVAQTAILKDLHKSVCQIFKRKPDKCL